MSYLNKNCTLGQTEESPFLAGRRAGTFNGFEVIPLRRSQGRQNAHIKGCVAGGLAKKGLYAQTLENSVKLDFRLPQSGAILAC